MGGLQAVDNFYLRESEIFLAQNPEFARTLANKFPEMFSDLQESFRQKELIGRSAYFVSM